MILKKIFFLFAILIVSHSVFADDYFKRHFLVIVDQTTDVQKDDSEAFLKVFSFIRDNILGENPDSVFVFDKNTDEISLYSFALPGAYINYYYDSGRFIGSYRDIHDKATSGQTSAAYKMFVEKLIQNASTFSIASQKGKSLEDFLDTDLRSLFTGKSNHFSEIENLEVPTAVTFSKYVYPVILEKTHINYEIPATEYFIIIASNFQSGLDDIGTSKDYTTLKQMLGESEKGEENRPNVDYFEKHFKALAAPFYQIPVCQQEYSSKKSSKDAKLTALIYKLGLRSLQGVSAYITSNIDINQSSFESTNYNIAKINVSFNHDKDVSVDSVKLVISDLSLEKDLYSCRISEGRIENGEYARNVDTRSYDFGSRDVNLGSRKIGDKLQFKYVFYATIKNENQTIMPMVFVADRNVILTENVFYPEFTLFEKMALIVFFIVLVTLAIFAWISYNRRGKAVLRGVNVKIWHISNSRFMELKDYHVVDRDCWYMRNGETQRLINITGSVEIEKRTFARPYQLKVEYKIDDVDNNEDFSFKPEGKISTGQDKEKSKWYEVPLNSDGTFEINAIAYQVDGRKPDLEGRENLLDMQVTVKAFLYKGEDVISLKDTSEYYHFIVRPEISNAALWMAFDPGTSGSCVAYGIGGNPTDKTNIKIAYNTIIDSTGNESQVSIFPSKIKIPDYSKLLDNTHDVDISILKEALEYGAEGDFYFGNLASVHEGRNSFQSIKKLLGYNDMHVLLDEQRREVRKLPGRDLALLLVKGLCNHFEQYIRTNSEVSDKERELFIHNNKFEPSRAIVAIPNNYTVVKAQDMVDSIKRTGFFKEVHYIYEAEGVIMCYLRDNWDKITNSPESYEDGEKCFVVFDMGGATINATAFSIDVITAQNNGSKYIREIELSTKARVGFNVGGDDIDFAWIRILYNIPAVKNYLIENSIKQEQHIKEHRTGLLKYVQKLKLEWMDRLSQSKGLSEEDIDRLWMDLSSDNGLHEVGIDIPSIVDKESADYLRNEWDTRSTMNKYVFSAVGNAITELLSMLQVSNIELIFSGRTSLYPGIKHKVIKTLKEEMSLTCDIWNGFENSNTGKNVDEVVKTAVAMGACWFAMFSNLIKLKHNIVTSTFGYVDLKNGRSTFIPLIKKGQKLDDFGNLESDPNYKVLTPNLPNIRILQMLTSKYDEVMNGLSSANKAENDKVKHLVNQLVHLTSDNIYGEIRGVALCVDDKNNFSYRVNVAGGQPLTGSGTVNDADIKTENSDAYAFSAMPCSEDVTTDRDVEANNVLGTDIDNGDSNGEETEISNHF